MLELPVMTASYRESHAVGDLVVLLLSLSPLCGRSSGAEEVVCVGTDFTAKRQHEFARSSFLASFSHELRWGAASLSRPPSRPPSLPPSLPPSRLLWLR